MITVTGNDIYVAQTAKMHICEDVMFPDPRLGLPTSKAIDYAIEDTILEAEFAFEQILKPEDFNREAIEREVMRWRQDIVWKAERGLLHGTAREEYPNRAGTA